MNYTQTYVRVSIRDFNVEESQSDGEENTDNKYVIDTIHKKVGSE